MKGRIFLFLLLVAASQLQAKTRPLSSKELSTFKQGKCVFYHFWATWCHPCLKELPVLFKWLESRKFIQPVVVDLSSPFSQKQFSKKWVEEALKPSFSTYVRPDDDVHAYVRSLDKTWGGMLPFSLLYHRGKKVQAWEGILDFPTLSERIPKLCAEKAKT